MDGEVKERNSFTLLGELGMCTPTVSMTTVSCRLQLLAIIGEQFIVGNEICGAVISVRGNEDIISLWNRTANDSAITVGIRYVVVVARILS